jgi:tetratricopeptide (TPR) repeat protein
MTDKRADWSLFDAEGAYAQSILLDALGDSEGSIAALEAALKHKPDYAPAILSMGSVEYQRGKFAKGKALFLSLLDLPDETEDLAEIVDEAGTFLIQRHRYRDGLDLFRAAVLRFPRVAAIYSGLSCCAGHRGLHEEALAAAETALELDPGNQDYVNDVGWSLLQGGRLAEAREFLQRAVVLDPEDALARDNLTWCTRLLERQQRKQKLG